MNTSMYTRSPSGMTVARARRVIWRIVIPLLTLLAAPVALAQTDTTTQGTTTTGTTEDVGVNGFVLNTIVGTVPLATQFGVRDNEEHAISRIECYTYLGQTPDSTALCGSSGDDDGTTDGTTTGTDTSDGGTTDSGTTTGSTSSEGDDSVCTDDRAIVCVNDIVYGCDANNDADTTDMVTDAEVCDDIQCGTFCSIACPACASGQTCTDFVCETAASAPGKADSHDSEVERLFRVTVTMESKTAATPSVDHDELAVAFGSGCSSTEMPIASDTCFIALSAASRNDWTNIDIEVAFSDFLSGGCESSGSTTQKLLFYVLDKNDEVHMHDEEFSLDFSAPSAPTYDDLVAGEENLKVKWSDDEPPDGTTYKVYYSRGTFTMTDIEGSDRPCSLLETETSGVCSKADLDVPDGDGYTLEGLQNNQTYYVGVVAVDPAGNESPICDTGLLRNAQPIEVHDFLEYYKQNGGQEQGGFGCSAGAGGDALPYALTFMLSFGFWVVGRREVSR